MMIVLGSAVVVMLASWYLLLRNNAVHNFRLGLIAKLSHAAQDDITAGGATRSSSRSLTSGCCCRFAGCARRTTTPTRRSWRGSQDGWAEKEPHTLYAPAMGHFVREVLCKYLSGILQGRVVRVDRP